MILKNFAAVNLLLAFIALTSFTNPSSIVPGGVNCGTRIQLTNYTGTIISSIRTSDDDEVYESTDLDHVYEKYVCSFKDPSFVMINVNLPSDHTSGRLLLVDIATGTIVNDADVNEIETAYSLKVTYPACAAYYRIEYTEGQ